MLNSTHSLTYCSQHISYLILSCQACVRYVSLQMVSSIPRHRRREVAGSGYACLINRIWWLFNINYTNTFSLWLLVLCSSALKIVIDILIIPKLVLKLFTDSTCITWLGREFQILTILLEKQKLCRSYLTLNFFSFKSWPLVLHECTFSNLGAATLSYSSYSKGRNSVKNFHNSSSSLLLSFSLFLL